MINKILNNPWSIFGIALVIVLAITAIPEAVDRLEGSKVGEKRDCSSIEHGITQDFCYDEREAEELITDEYSGTEFTGQIEEIKCDYDGSASWEYGEDTIIGPGSLPERVFNCHMIVDDYSGDLEEIENSYWDVYSAEDSDVDSVECLDNCSH